MTPAGEPIFPTLTAFAEWAGQHFPFRPALIGMGVARIWRMECLVQLRLAGGSDPAAANLLSAAAAGPPVSTADLFRRAGMEPAVAQPTLRNLVEAGLIRTASGRHSLTDFGLECLRSGITPRIKLERHAFDLIDAGGEFQLGDANGWPLTPARDERAFDFGRGFQAVAASTDAKRDIDAPETIVSLCDPAVHGWRAVPLVSGFEMSAVIIRSDVGDWMLFPANTQRESVPLARLPAAAATLPDEGAWTAASDPGSNWMTAESSGWTFVRF